MKLFKLKYLIFNLIGKENEISYKYLEITGAMRKRRMSGNRLVKISRTHRRIDANHEIIFGQEITFNIRSSLLEQISK